MRARLSPWTWTLGAILLTALILRLGSIRFGLPALNDPDELMFELGAVRMLRGPTLNPGWFGHPATTTMYVLALVDIGMFTTGWIAGWWPSIKAFGDVIYADPTWVILPGRVAMTLFAIGVIALTWRLGRRLVDPLAASVAALLLAVSPVHITWSQIIRSDMMGCFFLLLAMLAALDIAGRDRWRDCVRASLWIGAAVATKWPLALAAIPVACAMLLRVRDGQMRPGPMLARLAAVGAMSLAFLFLLSPYLLIDHQTVARNLTGEGQIRHLGSTGGTPLYNALWYLRGPLAQGLGPAAMVLTVMGLYAMKDNRRALALIVPLAAAFFLLLCFQTMVWERWALPLLPLGAILTGAAVSWIAARLRAGWRGPVAGALIIANVATPLVQARDDARARTNDTRQIASAWARAHIPPGSVVLIEHFAFDLLPQPWHFLFPIGDAGCVDAVAMLRGKTSYTPIDRARGTRANIDYGTMAPAQRGACRPDYAILTQYDRYRREAHAFPAEYAAYRDLLARGRIVARFDPVPGRIGGRNVTIVRFRNDRPAP